MMEYDKSLYWKEGVLEIFEQENDILDKFRNEMFDIIHEINIIIRTYKSNYKRQQMLKQPMENFKNKLDEVEQMIKVFKNNYEQYDDDMLYQSYEILEEFYNKREDYYYRFKEKYMDQGNSGEGVKKVKIQKIQGIKTFTLPIFPIKKRTQNGHIFR